MEGATVQLSGAQLGIAVAGLFALLIVLVINFVLRKRWVALKEFKSASVTAEYLCWGDLPRGARELLGGEAALERGAREEPEWRADCGWGLPGTEHTGVHFKSSVARSLWLVERYAVSRDESLRIAAEDGDATGLPRASRAVRASDYVARLRRAFPDLGTDTCRQYLLYYELARTPGRELSVREYDNFVRVLTDIRRVLCPGE